MSEWTDSEWTDNKWTDSEWMSEMYGQWMNKWING